MIGCTVNELTFSNAGAVQMAESRRVTYPRRAWAHGGESQSRRISAYCQLSEAGQPQLAGSSRLFVARSDQRLKALARTFVAGAAAEQDQRAVQALSREYKQQTVEEVAAVRGLVEKTTLQEAGHRQALAARAQEHGKELEALREKLQSDLRAQQEETSAEAQALEARLRAAADISQAALEAEAGARRNEVTEMREDLQAVLEDGQAQAAADRAAACRVADSQSRAVLGLALALPAVIDKMKLSTESRSGLIQVTGLGENGPAMLAVRDTAHSALAALATAETRDADAREAQARRERRRAEFDRLVQEAREEAAEAAAEAEAAELEYSALNPGLATAWEMQEQAGLQREMDELDAAEDWYEEVGQYEARGPGEESIERQEVDPAAAAAAAGQLAPQQAEAAVGGGLDDVDGASASPHAEGAAAAVAPAVSPDAGCAAILTALARGQLAPESGARAAGATVAMAPEAPELVAAPNAEAAAGGGGMVRIDAPKEAAAAREAADVSEGAAGADAAKRQRGTLPAQAYHDMIAPDDEPAAQIPEPGALARNGFIMVGAGKGKRGDPAPLAGWAQGALSLAQERSEAAPSTGRAKPPRPGHPTSGSTVPRSEPDRGRDNRSEPGGEDGPRKARGVKVREGVGGGHARGSGGMGGRGMSALLLASLVGCSGGCNGGRDGWGSAGWGKVDTVEGHHKC